MFIRWNIYFNCNMYFKELGSHIWSGKSPYHTSNNIHYSIISVSYSLTTGNIYLLKENHVTYIYTAV